MQNTRGSRMIWQAVVLVLFTFSSACSNNMKQGSQLKKKDIDNIRSLGLLDSGEVIYKFFCSGSDIKYSGNFYTDRRIASYYVGRSGELLKSVDYAFYPDIIAIDTVYYCGLTYSPYLVVTKTDSSKFQVFVEGSHEQLSLFFEDAIEKWHQNRKK